MTSARTQYQYICVEQPDGAIIGAATTSLIGFFGATPVVQQTLTTTNAVTSGSTTTVCNNAVTEIQIALGHLGLTCTNQ
jgi:hypothetical protein